MSIIASRGRAGLTRVRQAEWRYLGELKASKRMPHLQVYLTDNGE